MQTSSIVLLLCLVTVAVTQAYPSPAEEQESLAFDTPAHDSSPRNKRGLLLLLKKKLALGAIGLKAAKVGAVGAGVVGALALKAKAAKTKAVSTSYYHHGDLPLVIRY